MCSWSSSYWHTVYRPYIRLNLHIYLYVSIANLHSRLNYLEQQVSSYSIKLVWRMGHNNHHGQSLILVFVATGILANSFFKLKKAGNLCKNTRGKTNCPSKTLPINPSIIYFVLSTLRHILQSEIDFYCWSYNFKK